MRIAPPAVNHRSVAASLVFSDAEDLGKIQTGSPPTEAPNAGGVDYKSSVVAEMGDRLATIDMGRKEGGCCAPFRGAGSPSNTKSPGPRPTFIPSGILIHPAVWPQRTWTENRRLAVHPLFFGGGLGLYVTQCGVSRGLRPCQASF